MNDERWRALCLHLEEGWKGEMTEQRRAVYGTFLKHKDFEIAMDALKMLALKGQPWLPTVPELVATIRELEQGALPSWSHAWGQIQACMRYGHVLENTHPVVAAFIEQEGGVGRLSQVPFFDPDRGDMRVHQLGRRYHEFADVHQADERRLIALGSERLAALEGHERLALGAG
jgi:hypothetical protein